jgi:hypothetical protein
VPHRGAVAEPTSDGDLARLPWNVVGPKPWCGTYRFDDIAAGEHTLSLVAPAGYTLQSGFGPAVVTADPQPSRAPTAVLRANDVTVEIAVKGVCGPLPGATVTLLAPGATVGVAMTWIEQVSRYRSVEPVPPRTYTVQITHPLYADPLRGETAITASRTVSVDTDGNGEILGEVDITASWSRCRRRAARRWRPRSRATWRGR